jgi:hypothetical protein
MRFMVMIKASPMTEAGAPATEELLLAMGKYNEELVKAGVMLDGAGLMPSSKGARVTIGNGGHTVVDGPFAETKELIAGFWIWECRSLQEAIEWVKRCPPSLDQDSFEIRQLYELEDFGTDGEGIAQHEKVADMLSSAKGKH